MGEVKYRQWDGCLGIVIPPGYAVRSGSRESLGYHSGTSTQLLTLKGLEEMSHRESLEPFRSGLDETLPGH